MATYNVIDVSTFNTITSCASAAAVVDGVIMRCGYRGYGSSGTLVKDSKFETFYSGFYGKTKIGVYWVTQALNTTEAVAEANYVYSLISSKSIDFPVYLDIELGNSSGTGRADQLSKSVRTANAIAFCEQIKALGYRAGIYSSDWWYYAYLDTSQLQANGYSIWCAKYSSYSPQYVSGYDAWQYTSTASISGISGNCDKSYFYNDVAGWVTTKPDINNYTLSVPTTSFTYTGSAITPSFTLGSLRAGTDYTYSYSNNVNAGTGTCTITGAGNYQGTRTFNFTINPIDISSKTVTLSGYSFSYTGSAITPTVTSVDGVPSSSYTVSYSNNINVGTATANATGSGNYTGTATSKFTITQKSIESYGISLPAEGYIYTGEEIKPTPIIGSLVDGTDFTTTYEDNIEVGTATVTCRGKNNYYGTLTTTFRIRYNIIDITGNSVKLSYTTTVYNRQAQCPTVTVGELVEGEDYEMTVSNNTDVGTATIKITGIGDYIGTITKTFTITQCPISNYSIVIPASSYEYTGSNIVPSVTIGNLVQDTDYTLVYQNNLNVGTASITATAKGNYSGSISKTFSITQADISKVEATLSEYTYIYDGKYKVPTVTIALIETLDYSIKYYDNLNAGTASVVLTGIGNYTGIKTINYTINRQSIVDRTLVLEDGLIYYYNTQYVEPKATIEDLQYGTQYTIHYYENSAIGTARCVASGINNYQGDITVNFEIIAKPIELCYAKYGQPSTKTIYRIEDGLGLRIYTDSTEKYPLELLYDYEITGSSRKDIEGVFTLVEFDVKGFGGFCDDATFRFRTVDKEPETPIDYQDDGVYNFGDIDLDDETAYGDYNFKDLDDESASSNSTLLAASNDEVPEVVVEGKDYDFDAMSGMYLAEYDEDDGSNIDSKGNDNNDPKPAVDDDDGVYNFGDIDLGDETADGDYDYGDLDEGVDDDSVAKGDYDFNKLAGDTEDWLVAGTEFDLKDTPIYATYSAKTSFDTRTGTYFVYNSTLVNNRVRMARTDGAVEMAGRSAGWCSTTDLINLDTIKLGDRVIVEGNIFIYPSGSGGYIDKDGAVMYVTEVLDTNQYSCPYGLSSGPLTAVLGYASDDNLTIYDPTTN